MVLLLAVTAAAVVANLYYSQPLLNAIAATFRIGSQEAAWVTTTTQLGYATGLLFILPLGDALDRRLLMVLTTLTCAVALVCITLVHSLAYLLVANFCLGTLSVTPQLAVPYAATLAPANQRGRTVGTVMSGLLLGILSSRTLSGFIGARSSWQMVYWLAAVLMACLAVVLWRILPSQHVRQSMGYFALLRSLPKLYAGHAVLRRHSFLGAAGFGAFSMFWTILAFYLHAQPQRYASDVVGMFGVIGLSGALAAQVAGRWAERRSARQVNSFFLCLVILAFVLMALPTPFLLLTLAIGTILMDAGVQGSHIANQTRIYALPSELHSRINSVYMVLSFIGGAAGSQLAAFTWTHYGWPGVCAGSVLLVVAALVVLWTTRTGD
ncbi:MAG: MFS transporter [Verrucomicrobia bacterium]|nr:MFS transporter [Verrucomicrobiota bacterium]